MKVSDALLYQANQFSRTRSFRLNMELKNELERIIYDLGFGKLNKHCSTCVRIAMDRLNYELSRSNLPKLVKTENVKPTIHFIGVKQKTFNELRSEAKEKGFKATRKTTRQEIETFLKND
jgi:hypothetical protein